MTQADLVLDQCAADLESLGADAPAGAEAALGIGTVAKLWPLVQKLILDSKAKNYVAVFKDIVDILNILADKSADGELNFQAAHALGGGFFTKKLGEIIVKLLPVILGLL